jgi:hypothetical protein
MQNRCIYSAVAIASLGCLLAISGCATGGSSGASLIKPGLQIGQVRIGESLDQVHHALGKPDGEDAAMGGKLTEVWYSGPGFAGTTSRRQNELEIYFHGPGAGGDQSQPTVVVQVRVTSPFFKTESGISVQSSFAQIRTAYPGAHRDAGWEKNLPPASPQGPQESLVDKAAGIAFEFRAGARANPDKQGNCVAIHVFPRASEPLPIGSFGQ